MITKSKQNWEPGSAVKVGFLNLVVLAAVASPGDYKADQYLCRSAKGQHYAFVPHSGCFKIDDREAHQMRSGRPLDL